MFEQDFFMRIIHEMIRMLFKLIFQIDIDKEDEFKYFSTDDVIEYDALITLIDQGNINEAENRLIGSLCVDNRRKFEIALRFYEYLNTKDNDFLMSHDFSREEICEGIKSAAGFYGYDGILDCFLDDM